MHICLLGALSGHNNGAWRLPECRSDSLTQLSYLAEMARKAEDAKLDALFFGDSVTTMGKNFRQPAYNMLEPLSTMAALAAVTEHIGLIGTVSTTFTEPYNTARYLASIDHLSGGRAGWNIVTSFAGEENFGVPLPGHDIRYAAAAEYVEVVTRLWDSWHDDAVINDKANGVWARPDRIKPIDFAGQYYRVAGPLNVPRPPQGWPVLVQAGASTAGIEFAGRFAEVVFGAHANLEDAKDYYAKIQRAASSAGRAPGSVKVLAGLVPVVGSTTEEAHRLWDGLADLIDFEVGRAALSAHLDNMKLDDLDLDDHIPTGRFTPPDQVQGMKSFYTHFYKLATQGGRTLRELVVERVTALGYPVVIGTPDVVASQMSDWITHNACDGFIVMPTDMPRAVQSLCEGVIPLLRQRGQFRSDYDDGSTLRSLFGLARPLA